MRQQLLCSGPLQVREHHLRYLFPGSGIEQRRGIYMPYQMSVLGPESTIPQIHRILDYSETSSEGAEELAD